MKFFQKNKDEILQKQMDTLRGSDADLQQEAAMTPPLQTTATDNKSESVEVQKVPFSTEEKSKKSPKPFQFIPLGMGGGGRTHVPSQASRDMILEEVTLKDLTVMTETFYQLAFQDKTLDTFIRSHQDPHGTRFAKWIHQKLSASTIWDQDRKSRGRHAPVHDRTSAHVAAWHSPKRPAHVRGNHFGLDECRVWMRLHFWALRQSGLMEQSPTFADYYVRFIAHFVRVYESTAPAFARESLRWSADPQNIDTYLHRNGREMKDVLGLSLRRAVAQLPVEEVEDDEWPYNQVPQLQ